MKRTLGGILVGMIAGAVMFGGLSAAGALGANHPAAAATTVAAAHSNDATHAVPATVTPAPAPSHDATRMPEPARHETTTRQRTMRRDMTAVHHPEPNHMTAPAPAPTHAPAPATTCNTDGGSHDGGGMHR